MHSMKFDSKPSILHVYKDYYPPVLGGMEKCIHWICDQTRRDFHVRVLVAGRTRRFEDEVINGVRVVRVPCYARKLSSPLSPGFLPWLKRLDSDILHFHMPNPVGELAYLLARPKGKLVVTYHSDIVRQRLTGLLYSPLQHAFLRRASVIMPTSQRYLETSLTLRPHQDRCRVVPLGIPLSDYAETDASSAYSEKIRALTPDKIRLIFVGVLRYYKGLAFLLEALRGLPENVCLFLGGDGPERDKLQYQACQLGIADRVFFLGALDTQDEVVGLMRAGDIFCLPSHLRSEAFGLSQIEAMYCGLPVVGTNLATGVPEVNKDGESGLIVEPANSDAFRTALETLITNPELRQHLANGARHRAETLYSAQRMGDDLKTVYQQVLAGLHG